MPDRLRAPAALPRPRGTPSPAKPAPPLAEAYLGWTEVHRRTTLSRSTVWRLGRLGQFPKPVRVSPGRVAWREREVLDWMKHREENLGSYVP